MDSLKKILEKIKWGKREWAILFYSICFGIIYACGAYLNYETTSVVKMLWLLIRSTVVSFCIFWLLLVILEKLLGWAVPRDGKAKLISASLERVNAFCKWGHGLGVMVLLFLCWLPCYLSYYPGVFSYDMIAQYNIAVGAWSKINQHPPLAVLIVRICWLIGCWWDAENAIRYTTIVYSILQMASLAFVLAGLLRALARRTSGFLSLLGLLFFALNPVIALFSFSTTKDVWQTIFMVGLLITLLDWVDGSRNKGLVARTFLWGLCSCLIRRNFICAWVGLMIVLFFAIKKVDWKRTLMLCGGAVLVAFLLVTKVLYPLIGVSSPVTYEPLAVQLQQVARAICDVELTDEETVEMEEYFGLSIEEIRGKYNPRFADEVKTSLNGENYTADPGHFWEIWSHLLKKDPSGYLRAFLDLNLPLWYQGADAMDPSVKQGYVMTTYYDLFARENLLPQVRAYYDKIAAMTEYDSMGIWKWVFCLATPLWLMLASLTAMRARGEQKYTWILSVPFFYWVTFLFGAVSIARYMFPLMVLYPLFWSLPFAENSEGTKVQEVPALEE